MKTTSLGLTNNARGRSSPAQSCVNGLILRFAALVSTGLPRPSPSPKGFDDFRDMLSRMRSRRRCLAAFASRSGAASFGER